MARSKLHLPNVGEQAVADDVPAVVEVDGEQFVAVDMTVVAAYMIVIAEESFGVN